MRILRLSLICVIAFSQLRAQSWQSQTLPTFRQFSASNTSNGTNPPYIFKMPTASGEPPFTDTDGNCSFPNASPYWVATSGDPDGYSPGSGIMLNGTAVRRRPAAYSIGNPGAQIYGLQFEADFDGSASARSSSAEFDTAIMAIFYTDSECFLGGKEFGFWKETDSRLA